MEFKDWCLNTYPTGLNYQDKQSLIFFLRPQGFPVLIDVEVFVTMFSSAAQPVLDNGGSTNDVIQAMKDSDPENRLGYNTLI